MNIIFKIGLILTGEGGMPLSVSPATFLVNPDSNPDYLPELRWLAIAEFLADPALRDVVSVQQGLLEEVSFSSADISFTQAEIRSLVPPKTIDFIDGAFVATFVITDLKTAIEMVAALYTRDNIDGVLYLSPPSAQRAWDWMKIKMKRPPTVSELASASELAGAPALVS